MVVEIYKLTDMALVWCFGVGHPLMNYVSRRQIWNTAADSAILMVNMMLLSKDQMNQVFPVHAFITPHIYQIGFALQSNNMREAGLFIQHP
jgi:hypothetical protein